MCSGADFVAATLSYITVLVVVVVVVVDAVVKLLLFIFFLFHRFGSAIDFLMALHYKFLKILNFEPAGYLLNKIFYYLYNII